MNQSASSPDSRRYRRSTFWRCVQFRVPNGSDSSNRSTSGSTFFSVSGHQQVGNKLLRQSKICKGELCVAWQLSPIHKPSNPPGIQPMLTSGLRSFETLLIGSVSESRFDFRTRVSNRGRSCTKSTSQSEQWVNPGRYSTRHSGQNMVRMVYHTRFPL